ncbi:Methylesterase 3 [Platanthera guangdongensis]|uniref:Methylesterase 3 n=1 Tax=Platanthera guangdongensis TaxID=2320717 RepID=A0ABR2N4H0_9ASPA
MSKQPMKIILVHGGGHGAWCWYKVVAALKSQGYSATAIDLAACGSDPRRMAEDVTTFEEYAQPLKDFDGFGAGRGEDILVGHSDLSLATMMVRPTSFFEEDLSRRAAFSKERYGSVEKVFVICGEDNMLTPSFQRWMVENSPVKVVVEINGADHMAMLSKPQELCECIAAIVNCYTAS